MAILYASPFRMIVVSAALLLSLAACTPTSDTSNDNNANSNNDTKVKVDDRTTTDISPSGSFTKNSYDDIKLGASYDPQVLTQNTENLDGCFGAQSASHPAAGYMIIDNTVVEIVTSSTDILSAYGVMVGDSLEQLYAKHQGQQPEVENSPYGNPNENIILYYWYEDNSQSSEQSSGQRIGTKYQVDNNVVTSISIGFESALRLGEGCS